jgi:hypothetical protein
VTLIVASSPLVREGGKGFKHNALSSRRAQPQIRFRGEADMNRQARPARSVENDPFETWLSKLCCNAKQPKEPPLLA